MAQQTTDTPGSGRCARPKIGVLVLRGILLGLLGLGTVGLLVLSLCSGARIGADLIGLDEANLLRKLGPPVRDSRVEMGSHGDGYWLAFSRGDYLLVVTLKNGLVEDVDMWSR